MQFNTLGPLSVSLFPLQSIRQFSSNEHEKNRKQSLTSKEKYIHNEQNYFQFHCQVEFHIDFHSFCSQTITNVYSTKQKIIVCHL